jgi:glycosyltransferase involved in cell wall biosynthesis
MRVLVALPALDEERTVGRVASAVPRSIRGVDQVDVVVIDDGSSDGTARAAAAAGATVVSHPANRGLGWVFRTALRLAREGGYTALVVMDSDGQFDPAGIPVLLEPLIAGSADMVTCTRFAHGAPPGFPAVKRWGNRMVAGIVRSLTGCRVTDATCGFRAYGPSALDILSTFSRFTYTQEVLIDLAWKGLAIVEAPLEVLASREYGRSRISGNLARYAVRSVGAMYSAAHDYVPWRLYGIPGGLLLLLGSAAELFVLLRWLAVSMVTPFKGVAIGGLFAILAGLLLLIVASLADTSIRSRRLTEELTAMETRRFRRQAGG